MTRAEYEGKASVLKIKIRQLRTEISRLQRLTDRQLLRIERLAVSVVRYRERLGGLGA